MARADHDSGDGGWSAMILCLLIGLCVTFCGEPDLYDAVIFALMGGK